MITLRKHLTGAYEVKDCHGESLGIIKQNFFSPRSTITNRQGDAVGYTDIFVLETEDIAGTSDQNTSYVLVSTRSGERLATGLPIYNKRNTSLIRPPLADQMIILLQETGDKLFLHVEMDGSAMISGIGKDVSGAIKHLHRGSFLWISASPTILCCYAVFFFLPDIC